MRALFQTVRWSAVVVVVGLLVLLLVAGGPAVGASSSSEANVTLYRAPNATFDHPETVETVIENGPRDPAAGMVAGETLVVAIDSPRLAEAVANGSGTPTDRFLDAVAGNATFHIEETNPTTMRPPKVARLGARNVTVHRSGSTVYVLLDTGALTFGLEGDPDEHEPWRDGDRFAVTFGYDVDEDPPSGPTFALYSVEAEFFDQRRHEPLPPEVVTRTVRVNIEPTQDIVVRLTLGDEPRTKRVDGTGFRDVTFDLQAAESGTNYTLELLYDGEVVDRSSGVVREPRAVLSDASLVEISTEHVVTRDGERVTETITDHVTVNLTARLSHGGKVVVLDGTCSAVGHAWIDPANGTRVTVPLWEDGDPVRDRDLREYSVSVLANRYERAVPDRYRGPDAVADVNGGVPDCRPSTTATEVNTAPTSTDSPTPDTVSIGVTERSQTVEKSIETPGQPGFTATAAFVAVLVFALARVHRD